MPHVAQPRGGRSHRPTRTVADLRPHDPPHGRPRPPAEAPPRAGAAADPVSGYCPGFCARCDRAARVRLGAGVDSAAALCPDCRAAEHRDRAAPPTTRPAADR
jgi:hypothetical protein